MPGRQRKTATRHGFQGNHCRDEGCPGGHGTGGGTGAIRRRAVFALVPMSIGPRNRRVLRLVFLVRRQRLRCDLWGGAVRVELCHPSGEGTEHQYDDSQRLYGRCDSLPRPHEGTLVRGTVSRGDDPRRQPPHAGERTQSNIPPPPMQASGLFRSTSRAPVPSALHQSGPSCRQHGAPECGSDTSTLLHGRRAAKRCERDPCPGH